MKNTTEIIFGLATLSLMGLVLWHMILSSSIESDPPVVIPPSENIIVNTSDFRFALEEQVRIEIGQPIEGFEPVMFMQVFPGLLPEDFDGVEAMIGVYEYKGGELNHELGDVDMVHSAAPAVTELGLNTLFRNVLQRFEIKSGEVAVDEVMLLLKEDSLETSPSLPTKNPDYKDPFYPVACTMDAKICSDGSAVGRTGPNCEFSECPVVAELPVRYGENMTDIDEYRLDCASKSGVFNECASACEPNAEICDDVCSMVCEAPGGGQSSHDYSASIECSAESKKAEMCAEIYAPVCASVEVQCIATPCNPVLETFSNSCSACSQGNVSSYTEGACSTIN